MAILNTIIFLLAIKLMPHPQFPGKDMRPASITGYDLSAPDVRIILPDILHEVSGVTIINRETIAFVQDETGVVFIYSIPENRIRNKIIFGEKGDYEDLALVNNDIYVLRSDAMIFRIAGFNSADFKVERYNTGVPSNDSEGLCFDNKNNRLLIGCKGDIRKENLKNKRAVYSFDLKKMKPDPDPAYIIDPKTIDLPAAGNKKNPDKGKKDKKREPELRISALGINPVTGGLVLISSADNLLCLINSDGSVGEIAALDNELFRQPEGIAFFPNGDMLITNEAGGKKPTMLRFNFRADR